MKYKTFRGLMIGAAVTVLGLGGWQCRSCMQEQEAETRANATAPPQLAAGGGSSALPVLAGTVHGGSPESYLMATLGQPATEEKLKDVTNGRGSKINVYNEGGKWARAKVDHDRDEKWDEKWYLDGSIVVRELSPNDDEVYTRELRHLGGAWVEPGAAPTPEPEPALVAPVITPPTPSTATTTTPPGATAWRPLDAAVVGALAAPVQEKIKDATGSTAYKVNLYSDDKQAWNRLKIDLDRDEKWDEKWTLGADGQIEREVAPADDDVYTEKYERSGDAWVRK